MKKRIAVLLFCLVGILLLCAGCDRTGNTKATEETTEQTTKEMNNAVLYIGENGDFGKYNWPYSGDLTPQILMEGIAETTGWNLTLDKKVTKKLDGYIICFGETSVFYTGQNITEENEFYIPEETAFYKTVLDSITKTIRESFEKEDTLNLYYWGADDSDLVLTGIDKVITMDTAYEYDLIENISQKRYIKDEDANIYDVEGTFIALKGEEVVEFQVEGSTQIYSVTYTALKAIFKTAEEGRQMHIQITEDRNTGEKLITKIY